MVWVPSIDPPENRLVPRRPVSSGRQGDGRVTERHAWKASHNDDECRMRPGSGEGEQGALLVARHRQRLVSTGGEQVRVVGAKLEEGACDAELEPAVPPARPEPGHQRLGGGDVLPVDGLQGRVPRVIVDRTPIVGVDHRQVPRLATLINVGQAGDRELEHGLHEAVRGAERRDLARDRPERGPESATRLPPSAPRRPAPSSPPRRSRPASSMSNGPWLPASIW